MDATQHTSPLLNGNKAILLHFLSFDPTLKSHPQRATGMHGLPIAVGGSLASAVPRSVYPLLPAQHRAALDPALAVDILLALGGRRLVSVRGGHRAARAR